MRLILLLFFYCSLISAQETKLRIAQLHDEGATENQILSWKNGWKPERKGIYSKFNRVYARESAYFSSVSQNTGTETYSHIKIPAGKDFIGVIKVKIWNNNTFGNFGSGSRYTEIYYGLQWINGVLSLPGITTLGNGIDLSPYMYQGTDGFVYLRFNRVRSQNFIIDILSWDNDLYNQLSGDDLTVINSNSAELSASTTNYSYVPIGVNEYQNLNKSESNGTVTLGITNGNNVSFSTLDTDWTPYADGVETVGASKQVSSEYKNNNQVYAREGAFFSSVTQNSGVETYSHIKIPAGKDFIGVIKVKIWNNNTFGNFGAASLYTEIYYGIQWINGNLSLPGITTLGNGIDLMPYMYQGGDGFLYLRFNRVRNQIFILDILSRDSGLYNQLTGGDLTLINSNDAELSASTTNYSYVPIGVNEYQNLNKSESNGTVTLGITNGNNVSFSTLDTDWTPYADGVETVGASKQVSSEYKNNNQVYAREGAFFSSVSQNTGTETYSHIKIPAGKDFIGVIKVKIWNNNTFGNFGSGSRYTEIYYGLQWINGVLSLPGITTLGNGIDLSPYMYQGTDGFVYLRFNRVRSQNFIIDILSWDNDLYNQLTGDDLTLINSNDAELSPSTTSYTYVPLLVDEYQNLSVNTTGLDRSISISNGNTIGFNVADNDNDSTNEIELPTGGSNGQVLQTDGAGNYSWVNNSQAVNLETGNGLLGNGSVVNPLSVNFTEGAEAGKGIILTGVQDMKLKFDVDLVPTLRQDSNFVELKFADSSKINFVAPRDMSIFKVGNSIYFNPKRNFYFSQVPAITSLTVDSLYRRELDDVQMYGYEYFASDSTFQVDENGLYQIKYICNTSNSSFEMFQIRRDEIIQSSVQLVGNGNSTIHSTVGEDIFELIAGVKYYIEQYSSGGTLEAAKILIQKIN